MNAPRMLLIPALLAGLLLAGPAQAECPASAQQVAIEGSAVFASYEARDLEGVHLHASAVRRSLDCLQDRLTPQQAASAHVAMALSSFLNRDMETTEAAFRAARLADPDVALPAGVPEGHPLQQAYLAAAPTDARQPTQSMRGDPAFQLVVDGTTTTARPTQLPAVLQAVQGSASQHSTYLLPSSPLPDWASLSGGSATAAASTTAASTTAASSAGTASTVAPSTSETVATATTAEVAKPGKDKGKSRSDDGKADKGKRKGPSVGLLVASGGMALASAGLWTAAYLDGAAYIDNKSEALDATFDDEDELDATQQDLDAQYVRVNSLGFAAQGASALTGVLFVAAFVF